MIFLPGSCFVRNSTPMFLYRDLTLIADDAPLCRGFLETMILGPPFLRRGSCFQSTRPRRAPSPRAPCFVESSTASLPNA